jgi:iron complex outermembrane receptor protein
MHIAFRKTLLKPSAFVASLFAIGAVGLTVTPARASESANGSMQADPGQSAEARQAVAEGGNEIIVTATLRSESLQDVSLSVAAITGDAISDQNLDRLSQVADYIPNVTIGNSDAPARVIAIRGFGSGNNRGFETSVGLYLDGAYLGRELFITDAFFDLARVEAIRGPQGALFGKNTIAGAINFITANPTTAFEGSISGAYGNENKVDVEGFVSGPLSDTLSARLFASYQNQDGYFYNTAVGEDSGGREAFALRGKLRFEPDGNFDATVILQLTDFNQDGVPVQVGPSVPCVALLDPARPMTAPGCGPTMANTYTGGGTRSSPQIGATADSRANAIVDKFLSINSGTLDKRTNYFTGLSSNLKFAEHTLTFNTSFAAIRDSENNFDADYTAIDIYRLVVNETYDQWQNELRLTSPEGRLIEYIAGVYYFQSDIEGRQSLKIAAPFPGPPQGIVRGTADQRTKSFSIFGQATVNLSDQFRLIGGARYIDEKKTAIMTQTRDATLFIFQNYSKSLDFKDDDVLINGSFEFDLSEDVMIYASYAEGYKSGGLNFFDLSGSNPSFDSEQSQGYEAGVRTSLFDGAATLNGTIFYTKFQNLQTSALVGTALQITNAAQSTSKGVEIELQADLSDRLSTRLSFAHLDAEFAAYPNAPCSPRQVINTLPPCSANFQGVPLEGAQDFSGAWNLTYELPLSGALDKLTLSSDLIYTGNYRAFSSGTDEPGYYVGGYYKLNARIALDSTDRSWTLSAQGTNLTNRLDVFSIGNAFQNPGSTFANLNQPRQWTVEVTYRF